MYIRFTKLDLTDTILANGTSNILAAIPTLYFGFTRLELTISILLFVITKTIPIYDYSHSNIMNHNSGFIIGIADVFCKNPNRTHT